MERGKVTIIGGGVVGTNAAKIAVGMGADVTILDLSAQRLAYLDDIFGSKLQTLYSNHENIVKCLKEADLVVGAVLMVSIMALSAFVSAPAHGDLASGFNVEVHNDLMFGNLIRSILWTARGCVAAAILWITVTSVANKVET